jgi:hypothetical protein
MPSLHVAWATWVCLVTVRISLRRLARVAALANLLVTSLVVVATGNHWVLDAAAGVALALVCCTAGQPAVIRSIGRIRTVSFRSDARVDR